MLENLHQKELFCVEDQHHATQFDVTKSNRGYLHYFTLKIIILFDVILAIYLTTTTHKFHSNREISPYKQSCLKFLYKTVDTNMASHLPIPKDFTEL